MCAVELFLTSKVPTVDVIVDYVPVTTGLVRVRPASHAHSESGHVPLRVHGCSFVPPRRLNRLVREELREKGGFALGCSANDHQFHVIVGDAASVT